MAFQEFTVLGICDSNQKILPEVTNKIGQRCIRNFALYLKVLTGNTTELSDIRI